MPILALKLLITPFLIGGVTLAGRRWGSIVSGFLIGLPLTSGPISFLLAYEFGLAFSSQAAVGSLAGQLSNCLFCLTYTRVARRCNWVFSSLAAISAFLLATFVWNSFAWQLWPAFALLLVVIVLTGILIPRQPAALQDITPPKWDLPARILTATGFVLCLTSIADTLGPHLSGLISPFPVFILIFSAFTHAQQGANSASNLLRGVVLGSGSYASFFLIVGALLPRLGIAVTYLLASLVAIAAGGLFFFVNRQSRRSAA